MAERITLSLIQIVLLSLWLGSAIFFAAAVAPALFASLPSRSLAGSVVGRLLPVVFIAGIAAGTAVIVLRAAAGRAGPRDLRSVCGGVLVAACAVAQLGIAPRIERVRAEIAGPVEALAATDPRRLAFGRLHGLSVAWLGVGMLAAAVALAAAWRSAGPPANQ